MGSPPNSGGIDLSSLRAARYQHHDLTLAPAVELAQEDALPAS
jgi:hypothetical protein